MDFRLNKPPHARMYHNLASEAHMVPLMSTKLFKENLYIYFHIWLILVVHCFLIFRYNDGSIVFLQIIDIT